MSMDLEKALDLAFAEWRHLENTAAPRELLGWGDYGAAIIAARKAYVRLAVQAPESSRHYLPHED